MEIKLSILIPYTASRLELVGFLNGGLTKQKHRFGDSVEIVFDDHETDNVGIKRNRLLSKAKGVYVVFIDSDDHVSSDYVGLIMQAIEYGSDCIGISGTVTTNGGPHQQWRISKEYGSWFTRNGVHYRTPNHISPIKRELALKAGFPEISFGEDAEFSKRVLPFLQSETTIHGNIYHYDYWKIK